MKKQGTKQLAKNIVRSWLETLQDMSVGYASWGKMRWEYNRPIVVDYPLGREEYDLTTIYGRDHPWDEILDGLDIGGIPEESDLIKGGYIPIGMVDVGVFHKGIMAYAIFIVEDFDEILCRNLLFLESQYTAVVCLPLQWVLSQTERPEEFAPFTFYTDGTLIRC